MKFKSEPLPDEFWDWWLVKRTGWTLEQVNALSQQDFHNLLSVLDGAIKAKQNVV